ncbi:MAG: hypothetical protein H7175_10055 [Burkholderiales bacterium]|nr:hypothetical protein [Anaerolineae bacterium]
MRRFVIHLCLLLVGCAFAACSSIGGGSGPMETAVAENASLQTQIVDIRATATVEADIMLVTVEHAMTIVREVDTQNQRLQATLIQQGTPPEFISQTMPQSGNITAPLTNLDASAFITPRPGGAAPTPVGSSGVVATPLPSVNQVLPTPTTAAETSSPALLNISTSRSVGADDCPLEVTSSFSSSDVEIYVSAVAMQIESGMTIASRWSLEGQELISFDFTPNFAIDGGCIWFFITPDDVAFTPGNWSVALDINGTVSGTASFSIIGDSAVPAETVEAMS